MKYTSNKCGSLYIFKTTPDTKNTQPDSNKSTQPTGTAPHTPPTPLEQTCLKLFSGSLSPIKQSAPELCQWLGNAYKQSMQKKPQDSKQKYEYHPTGGRGHKLVMLPK